MASSEKQVPEAVRVMKERLKKYATDEGRLEGLSLITQPDDVICSCAQKSGSIWLLHIIHGLRSRGNLDFDEVCVAVPMIEGNRDWTNRNIEEPQGYHPRMFSTHMGQKYCPKGAGKYIVLVRDPCDCVVSHYKYLCDWVITSDEVSLDDFTEFMWLPREGEISPTHWPSHLHHIASWYPHRLKENVLWIHFEDMKADLPKFVEMLSKFLNIYPDDKKLHELVIQQASIEFMKEYHSKFDSHNAKKSRNANMGLDPDAGLVNHCGRVRAGKSGTGRKELSATMLQMMDDKWKAVLGPVTGFASYGELRLAVNKELGRSFDE